MICCPTNLSFTHPYPVVEGVAASEEDQLLEGAAAQLSPTSAAGEPEVEETTTPRTSGIDKNIRNLRVNTANLNSEPFAK